MSISQAFFLTICLATGILCLRAAYVSLRQGRRYHDNFWRCVRIYCGTIISTMLAVIAAISVHRIAITDGGSTLSLLDWIRALLDLAIGALFLSILRAFDARDHLETALAAASHTDPLTRLPNRAGFDALATSLLEECSAKRLPATVAMLDIDRFKAVNDGWGHLAGDEVLRSLAKVAREAARAEDVMARYGGEEFILLLKGIGPEDAYPMVERVREAISAKIAHPSGEGRITVSAGIAPVDGSLVKSLKLAIHRADEALYGAKNAGRDRSVIFSADRRQDRAGEPDAGQAVAQ